MQTQLPVLGKGTALRGETGGVQWHSCTPFLDWTIPQETLGTFIKSPKHVRMPPTFLLAPRHDLSPACCCFPHRGGGLPLLLFPAERSPHAAQLELAEVDAKLPPPTGQWEKQQWQQGEGEAQGREYAFEHGGRKEGFLHVLGTLNKSPVAPTV